MDLSFTKGPAKLDWLDIVRGDGTKVPRIDCPKQRIIPHDMVHFAVESVLEARGFLGEIAGGGTVSFANGEEPAEAVERLVETMQAEAWAGPANFDANDLIDLYKITCDAREHPAVPVDRAAIEAIQQLISDLDARWAAVPVGGMLKLTFRT